MRKVVLAALAAAGLLVVTSTAQASGFSASAVDDDGKATIFNCNSQTAASPTIQGAVDAADPGELIVVCPGTYTEQVTIPAGKDKLTLVSQKPWQAIIQAPSALTAPNAIVRVNGAQKATIAAFTIQGPGAVPGQLMWGVRVDNDGSANILGNKILHIRDDPFTGIQTGIGVLVGRQSESTTGSAFIAANLIEDYQKGGVVISNTGSEGTVLLNKVRGNGPTPTIASNGVQVSGGADGKVEFNDISGNVFTPQSVQSVGVLGFQPGELYVKGNVVHDNDGGVVSFFSDATTTIRENHTFENTFDGIELDGADGSDIRYNRTFRNGLDGVGLYSGTTNVEVYGNKATDNTEDGLLAYVDASGNTFKKNFALNNAKFDCEDQTVGTMNTWTDNVGPNSSPPTICGPASSHHHSARRVGSRRAAARLKAPVLRPPTVKAFR